MIIRLANFIRDRGAQEQRRVEFKSDDPIADATQVYGDTDSDYPEIDTPCDQSPSGQCEFNALVEPERCIHCGRKT